MPLVGGNFYVRTCDFHATAFDNTIEPNVVFERVGSDNVIVVGINQAHRDTARPVDASRHRFEPHGNINVLGYSRAIDRKRKTIIGPVGARLLDSAATSRTRIAGDEIPSVIDEIPALAIAAAFAEGITEIRDAEELAVKESNRIGAIQQELQQLGIGCEAHRDGLTIRGGIPKPGATLKSHGDHRIALAAAIAAHALDGPSPVRGWAAVAVSYPEFRDDLAALAGGQ